MENIMEITNNKKQHDRRGVAQHSAGILLILCIFLASPNLSCANTYDLTGPLEITHCAFSASKTKWALAMEYNPAKKIDQQSVFFVLRLGRNGAVTQYDTGIPVGPPVTPYRAKNQVCFFKLIGNRYLYIGTKKLDGTIYFVKFDTHHPDSKQRALKLHLKGDNSSANILVTSNGELRFVGFESGLPYIVAMDSEHNKIYEKKGLGLTQHIGTLKFSIMLDNDSILLVFHTYKGQDAGTSFLVVVNKQGVVTASKRLQGLAVEARATNNGGAIVLIAHDQNGKDMEAQAVDGQLQRISHFPTPGYFKLIDAAGQLIALNSTTLLSMQIDRRPGSRSFINLETYSRSGSNILEHVKNPQPGKLRAYNISAQLKGNILHIGTAVIGIDKSNKGQKTYFIHSIPVH